MSSNPVAIQVQDLGKRYQIGATVNYRTLRETLVHTASAPLRWLKRSDQEQAEGVEDHIWALRHVDFEVKQGQVLGIVGKNGAGKSTLLKLLSRITEPTEGKAIIHGRVGSLLEVGTGFHPELTGRENIFLNGAILGMRRSEIESKFDEIVGFAEVEKFIDTPVKRYSSGMYLRLAFAVAAHLEPEILLVDEVLAVGDAAFQRKCLGKMSDVAQQGRTVLFVSHNMSAVLRLTQETIVIDQGQLVLRAPTPEAVDYYMTSGLAQSGERVWGEETADMTPFQPIAVRVLDEAGRVNGQVMAHRGFEVEFEYRVRKEMAGLRVGMYLFTSRGEPVFTSFDTDEPQRFESLTNRPAGRYISRAKIPGDLINEGRFVVGVNASSYRIQSYFTDEYALTFTADAAGTPGSQWPERRVGPVRPDLTWEIERIES